ncbi:MAG: 3D domain-containing protein [Tissierellia bacterium]|nr:3D domain-containing protein [Tissierellia bacterium]
MILKRTFLIFILIIFLGAISVHAEKVKVEFRMEDQSHMKTIDTEESLEQFIEKEFPGYGIFDRQIPAEGVVYNLEPLQPLELNDGGTKRTVEVPLRTVKEILQYLNVEVREKDVVLPALDKIPEDGKIFIFRIEEKHQETQEVAPFEIIEKINPLLQPGTEKVIQEGRDGLKRVIKEERYVNGILRSVAVIKEEILQSALPKIVEKGKPMPEVITRGEVRSIIMVATAYEAGPRSTGKRPGDRGYGITASGTLARRGTVAVDPRVIPLGTKFYIKSLDPEIPDYGYAIAEDTGGAIKGHKIDLFMNTVAECFQFGRRKVMVYILPADTPIDLFN